MWSQQQQNDDIEQISDNIELNGKQKPENQGAGQGHGHGSNLHL